MSETLKTYGEIIMKEMTDMKPNDAAMMAGIVIGYADKARQVDGVKDRQDGEARK